MHVNLAPATNLGEGVQRMPFKIYSKLEDVPEAIRGDYRQQGDKAIPVLTDDHPLVIKRNELATAVTDHTQKETDWKAEKIVLEQKAVPSGKRVIDLSDFNFLTDVKGLSLSVEELKKIVTDYPDLQKVVTETQIDKILDRVAKDLKYENVATFKAVMKGLGVKVEYKKTTVTDAKGVDKEVEVPYVGDKKLSDYIQETESLKASESAFKTPVKKTAPDTEAGKGTSSAGASGNDTNPENLNPGNGGDKATVPDYRFTTPGDVKW